MSHVTGHMLRVTSHLSLITCHLSPGVILVGKVIQKLNTCHAGTQPAKLLRLLNQCFNLHILWQLKCPKLLLQRTLYDCGVYMMGDIL